ncbi:MAG: family 43 glycosylhydrolase [Anaerolineae bacterium]|nr:family 43 glycosylhydrolase [Anaerolineae bacterium]
MPKSITRRDFLRSGAVLGAGVGLSHVRFLPRHQETPEVPPTTPFEIAENVPHVHDPMIIRGEDAYYLFSTGANIPVRRSVNLVEWSLAFPPTVQRRLPDWAREAIPGAGDIWAPDVSYFNGKYHLYYSVSTFGSNRSAIGLTTNTTLDATSDAFEWVDQGMVVESQRSFNYNCIDPNLVLDADGAPWLAFGSFWTGIKMRRIDIATGKPSTEDERLYSLAQRFVEAGSVEAAFIVRREGFYYLFVSFDFCCRGVDSTYRVMVGRSEAVTGPYVDHDGVEMLRGGGTQITFPTERWKGPGHCSILQENGIYYLVYHSYDAELRGTPTLRIDILQWDADGWPSIMQA